MPTSTERREGVQQDYQRLMMLVGILVFVAVITSSIALHTQQDRLLATTGSQLALAADGIASDVDYALSQRYGELRVLVKTLEARHGDPSAAATYLDSLAERYRLCCWIGVADANGVIVASTERATISQDVSASAWFRTARDSHGTVTLGFRATQPLQGRPMMSFSAPLRDERGGLIGALTLHVGYHELERIIVRTIEAVERHQGLSHRLEWALLSKDGDLIDESLTENAQPMNLKALGLPSATSPLGEGLSSVEETHVRRHVPVITGFAGTRGYGEFPNPGLRVLVRLDRSSIEAPIRHMYLSLGAGLVLVFGPILGVLLWLTARLRQEWARAASQEERWELMLHNIGDAVITVDRNERISYLNPSAERLLGWTATDALGRPAGGVIRAIGRNDRRPIESLFSSVVRSGDIAPWPQDAVLQPVGGSERILQGSVTPLRDAEEEISGAIMVLHDVTEHRLAQEARAKLAAIVESSDDAIIGKTLDGTITAWNHGAERMYGYTLREMIGQSIRVLFPSDRPDEFATIHDRLKRGERVDHYETVRIRKDGRAIPVSVSISPIKNDQGEIVGAASIARALRAGASSEDAAKGQD